MLMILWLILSVFFACYGAMVLATGSGSGFYMVWLVCAVLCCLFALAAKLHLWGMLNPVVRRLFLALMALGAVLYLFTMVLIASQAGAKGEKGLDVIIVLGAQIRHDGPSVVLRRRLDTAEKYLRENPDTICIVSGGQGYNEPITEAEGMAAYLIGKGIAPERILLEDASTNTVENLTYSLKLLSDRNQKVGVVTNNFHVFRAVHIAKRQGLTNVCGLAAPSEAIFLLNNATREVLGIWKDFLFGNLA